MAFEFIYNVPSEYTYSGRKDMEVLVKGNENSISIIYKGKEVWDVNEKGNKCI